MKSWLFNNRDPKIMVYNNPHITGFSTFDLSARETSHTTGQHLRDSRALSGIKLVRPHCDPMKKKWSKKLHCTLLRPSIRTRNELPPTRIALAFVSPIKFWKWSSPYFRPTQRFGPIWILYSARLRHFHSNCLQAQGREKFQQQRSGMEVPKKGTPNKKATFPPKE